jgi:hypothetical protein
MTTAQALLRGVGSQDADVAVTATHALISMASPEVPAALAVLQGHADQRARALAAGWVSAWSRRGDQRE